MLDADRWKRMHKLGVGPGLTTGKAFVDRGEMRSFDVGQDSSPLIRSFYRCICIKD
jgi:hypothetical protein